MGLARDYANMNLWIVGESVYVLADGPAGAIFLADMLQASVRMLKRDAVSEFRPRVISREEALELL